MIDFGDVSFDCYVFELSILVMAVLTMKSDCGEVAECIIAGYCSRRPLLEQEWLVLYVSNAPTDTCIQSHLSSWEEGGANSMESDMCLKMAQNNRMVC